MREIYHGAEAVITEENKTVIKARVSKGYRIQQIDSQLRSKRTRLEARLMREARRCGVLTPQITEEDKFTLRMEFIDGERLKDALNKNNFPAIARIIGQSVAIMHNYDIIHGDLTTSNMIIKAKGKNIAESSSENRMSNDSHPNFDIYFIDFGLGFFSKRAEDKATDLHLLKEALESAHYDVSEKAWKIVIDSYKASHGEAEKVIKALSKIEKRGRYVER